MTIDLISRSPVNGCKAARYQPTPPTRSSDSSCAWDIDADEWLLSCLMWTSRQAGRWVENDFYEVSNGSTTIFWSKTLSPTLRHSGAIVEPWIQKSRTLIDEVPNGRNPSEFPPPAVSETPVIPARASCETVVATNKPVAVTYHTGGQAEVVATPATCLPKTGQDDWFQPSP